MELKTSNEIINNDRKEISLEVNGSELDINFLDIERQKDDPSQIIKITILGFLRSLTLNIINLEYVDNIDATIDLKNLCVNDLKMSRLVRGGEIR
jgi:hypothetical protein